MRWCYWQGNALAIHGLWVLILTGHHCVVALSKLLTPVCLSPSSISWYRQWGDFFGWWKVTAAYHWVYDEVTCRLTAKKPGSALYLTLTVKYGTTGTLLTYHHQWLPNTKWWNSRSAWAGDRWLWRERLSENKGFEAKVKNAIRQWKML